MVPETQGVVYVVEDDPLVRYAVEGLMQSAGLKVEAFPSGKEFLEKPHTAGRSCLVLDLNLPGLSGLDVQEELARSNVQVPIIFLTGHGDIRTSVRAMKSGAVEFFTKPFDDEALLSAVRQAMARAASAPPTKGPRKGTDPVRIVGVSPGFKATMNAVAMVAKTDSTVLICGETGTGKEVVAQAIHAHSQRSAGPLVSVNCGAIQQSLIASELFGHEKGSFTGALQQRPGRFELADGGTIFLDEVGELPSETQVALLRVLQERQFERVGGSQPIRVDVRIIAATNRDLDAAISGGTFRSDLFYRLNVFPIQVPPLRERKEDIPLLVEHFLERHAKVTGKKIRSMEDKTMEALQTYSWPGNIRELQNVIERWAILCDDEHNCKDGKWLPWDSQSAPKPVTDDSLPEESTNLRQHVEDVERRLIREAMAAVGGNQSAAARRLGLSRGSLLERLKRYGNLNS